MPKSRAVAGSRRKRGTHRHHCTLPDKTESYMRPLAPFSPWYIKFRRYILKCCILSERNPRCEEYFFSRAAVFREKQRQVSNTKYHLIVHPFSRVAWYREKLMCFLWLFLFFSDPFFGTFLSDEMYQKQDHHDHDPSSAHQLEHFREHTVLILQVVVNVIVGFDIFLNFFIGYTVPDIRLVVLDMKSIVKNYAKTYFFFDLIGVSYIFFKNARLFGLYRLKKVGYQLHHFRFIRIITTMNYLKWTLKSFKVRESMVSIIMITLITLLVIHWWSCTLLLIPTIRYYTFGDYSGSWLKLAKVELEKDTTDHLTDYFKALLITMCHFYGAGLGHYPTQDPTEMVALALIVMSGYIYYVFCTVKILLIFGAVNISETKFEELISQASDYMNMNKFPPKLCKRIFTYYEYKFQGRFFWEQEVLQYLSEHLQYEVSLYSCRRFVENTKIFKGVSQEAIGSVLARLTPEVYLPLDIILGSDDLVDNIYFISYGTVMGVCKNADGDMVEAGHLEDGQHFGDLKLMAQYHGEVAVGDVIAIEITEVFTISFPDLKFCIDHYPDLAVNLSKHLKAALAIYRKMQRSHRGETEKTDILAELRKSRILTRGKERCSIFL